MRVRVIIPPSPLITPSDILGNHGAEDQRVKMLIAAAQEEIDGPDGWLGRSIGPQTLEASVDGFNWTSMRLPCPPLIDVISITYLDKTGIRRSVDGDLYEALDGQIWLRPGKCWPAHREREGSVMIRYQAGYNGAGIDSPNGTGPVPASVKAALQLTVQHTLSMGVENLFLRAEEVEGVGTTTYTISTVASDMIKTATDRFLGGLRLYA